MHPASDWPGNNFKRNNFRRFGVDVVVDDDSKDEEVKYAANHFMSSSLRRSYNIGGKNRNNCCDWVSRVLWSTGLSYKNPNPKPFGDIEPLPGIHAEDVADAVDFIQNDE